VLACVLFPARPTALHLHFKQTLTGCLDVASTERQSKSARTGIIHAIRFAAIFARDVAAVLDRLRDLLLFHSISREHGRVELTTKRRARARGITPLHQTHVRGQQGIE
jgi:hypothetical protein